MKQAAFSTEQRDELVRLSKLVPTLPMKQAQADFIAQDVISDQKLNSKTLETLVFLDALPVVLTDGKSNWI